MSTDTIFAPATAPGRSGVAVFRLSGPQALAAVQALSGRQTFPARKALRVVLSDPQTQTPLDDGLAIFFPAPRSFTGEDVVELHIHGGHATQSAIHKALVTCPGLRLAEPGAFTKRGYLNGKMDLAQVEALADLVAAETEQQRLQALEASKGALGQSCRHWRDRLARGYAHLCAVIDFPDEDLPDHIEAQLRTDIQTLCAEIESGLKAAGRTER
ncbi:MAG: tRNA uridine-5-carboxymethylaminomethyl(34) synthesis GTPase MnmE, partial [Rhodospirillaceae bacterium]